MRYLLIATVTVTFSLASLLASTPAVPWNLPPIPGTDPIDYSVTIEKLKALKVDVQWENGVEVAKALKDLELKSKQADPKHLGVKFELSTFKESEKAVSHGGVVHQKISILLQDVSIYTVLEYVNRQTNLEVQIGKNIVALLPPS